MENGNLQGYLYEKIIQEAVHGGQAYYRPAHFAASAQAWRRGKLDREGKGRSHRLMSVKVGVLPPMRVRLPRWVSVHMVSL